MSFVGSVEKLPFMLMLMKSALEKVIIGPKYPVKIRTLQIVVLELLRALFDKDTSYNGRLPEHWIKNLIYPVLSMTMYVHAEREDEFGLHLYACKSMMPYFFSAGY